MIQQRVPYSNAPNGHVWVDPSRDIAHAFPNYIRRALEVAEHDIENSSMDAATKRIHLDGLSEDAKKMAAFIKSSFGENRTETIIEAFDKSAILSQDTISPRFIRALFKVLCSAYWTGLGFALHGEADKPVDADLVDRYTAAK